MSTARFGVNAGAAYAVNINPATSSFANVSGAATLGGATVNAIYSHRQLRLEAVHDTQRGQRQRHVRLADQQQHAGQFPRPA